MDDELIPIIEEQEQNLKIIADVMGMVSKQELSFFEMITCIENINKLANELKPIYIKHKTQSGEKFMVKL